MNLKYWGVPKEKAGIIEALVKIAEQLELINKNLEEIKKSGLKVKGGINTHAN